MGIEIRKGRYYWYDRKRVNGRVQCNYYGAVPAQGVKLYRLQAELDAEHRAAARTEEWQLAKWADGVLAAGEEFDRLAIMVFRATMFSAGYRLHNRSQWRRQRGAVAMGKFEASTTPTKGHDPQIECSAERPGDRELLKRAAAGDASVLDQVRELLLRRPEKADELGSVVIKSLLAMIVQTSGKNYAVVEAMIMKYREDIDELLSDYPNPSHAERMAATRAANNWMAVHILESRTMIQSPTSAGAMLLERRVTLAEKRLHASLRSLAVLRRLRKPAAPKKQVNIANVGPMVVSNG